ncbi:MAG: Mrp/NBP35 family ATP-binding protein [Thermodesulfobacteriota bacterium]|nr:Mrp/NBP35 family ATP-binding protein [Thermodesulfobacteriota bacterium]
MAKTQEGVSFCETKQQHQQQQKKDPAEAIKQSLSRIKHKFIIMSGKGGVGKSSTSVNLSIALANKGYKVGLMDVDIHGPDIPRMLGLTAMPGVTQDRKMLPVKYSDNLGAISIESLSQSKDDAIIWRGPVKHSVIQQFIGDVDWGELDFLIIDSPPGTGDEPLTVAQVIPGAKAIIVTTPQEVALADIRKSINFCKTVKMEAFGLIENMSGFTCPHCGKAVELFGSGGGRRTAEAMGVNYLGEIPFDVKMVECGDAGTSYQEQNPDTPVTRAFAAVADAMAKLVE